MVSTIIGDKLLTDDKAGLYQDIITHYSNDGDESALVNVVRDLLK
jgi:hypothetical protein